VRASGGFAHREVALKVFRIALMGEPLWAAWVSSRLYQTLRIEYNLRAKASSLGAVAVECNGLVLDYVDAAGRLADRCISRSRGVPKNKHARIEAPHIARPFRCPGRPDPGCLEQLAMLHSCCVHSFALFGNRLKSMAIFATRRNMEWQPNGV
jgi:hypothetical protein